MKPEGNFYVDPQALYFKEISRKEILPLEEQRELLIKTL